MQEKSSQGGSHRQVAAYSLKIRRGIPAVRLWQTDKRSLYHLSIGGFLLCNGCINTYGYFEGIYAVMEFDGNRVFDDLYIM